MDGEIRVRIYRLLLEGQEASVARLAADSGLSGALVQAALDRLAAAHLVVLERGSQRVRMANPLSAVPTDFQVELDGSTCWANCIWDALGIPAMLGREAIVRTSCLDCGEALTVEVGADGVLCGSRGVVHFAVPAARWWDDIVYT